MITENTFLSINYGIVLLATVANFLIGVLWYSPFLLGKNWMREMVLTETDMKERVSLRVYIIAFIYAFIAALFLSVLINSIGFSKDIFVGAYLGLFASIGFIGTSMATNYLFEKKSIELLWITVGRYMISFMVMGAIIGAWG